MLSLGLEIPLWTSVLLLGLSLVQIVPGVIWIAALRPTEASIVVFGIGAALGIVTSTMCDVLMFELSGKRTGFALPLAVATLVFLRSRDIRQLTYERLASLNISRNVSVIFSLGLLHLARDFRWFLVPFLATAVMLMTRPLSPRWRVGLWTLTTALSILSWWRKPSFWWFITDDFQVFESISYHFTEFGVFSDLGPLGPLGPQYHVLTYQWSGFLAKWSGAEPYTVLNRYLPVLTAFLVSSLVWAFLDRSTKASFPLKFVAAFAFPLLINYSFVSPSYAVGVTVLLAAFHFWNSELSVPHLHRFAISFVFAGSLALIKSSNIPVVVLGLAGLVVTSFRQPAERRLSELVNLLGAYLAIFTYGFIYLLNDRTSRQISSFRLFGYAKQIVPDIDLIADRPIRATAALVVGLGTFIFPFAASLSVLIQRDLRLPPIKFAVTSLPFAFIFSILAGNQANGYFVQSGLNLIQLCALVIAVQFVHEEASGQMQRRLIPLALVALVVSLILLRISEWSNGGSIGEIWFRVIEASMIASVMTIALALYVVHDRRRPLDFIRVVVIAIFISVVARETILIQTLEKGPELSTADSYQAIGSPAERDVIEKIRYRLPAGAVLATNRFCELECTGVSWLERDLSLLADDFNLPSTPSGFGGSNFRLSAETRRRVLIEGPRWLIVNGYPISELRHRMLTSLTFAESASSNSRDVLKALGVTHFVLHLPSRESDISLRTYGPILIRNSEYIVFSL